MRPQLLDTHGEANLPSYSRLPAGVHTISTTLVVPTGGVIEGDGWATILRRDPAFSGNLVELQPGAVARDFTLDGAFAEGMAHIGAEVALLEDSALEHVQVVRSCYIGATFRASRCRVSGCTFVGVGSATDGAWFGVWADDETHVGSVVESCRFRGYRLNAAYLGGRGRMSGCDLERNHCQILPTGGGQIATSGLARGWTISHNDIGPGGGPVTSGVEVDGVGVDVSHNHIRGQGLYGIAVQFCEEVAVVANQIEACGIDGIAVLGDAASGNLIGNACRRNGRFGLSAPMDMLARLRILNQINEGNTAGGFSWD